MLELSAWVIVLTIAVLPIILGAIALWDSFRFALRAMRSYSTDG
jgi:hypothetical protein